MEKILNKFVILWNCLLDDDSSISDSAYSALVDLGKTINEECPPLKKTGLTLSELMYGGHTLE